MTRRKQHEENGDRVTLRTLYDVLRDYPTRRELYLLVGGGLVLGQIAAAASSPSDTRGEQAVRLLLSAFGL